MVKIKSSPELNEKIILFYLSGKNTYETATHFNCSQCFIINTLKRCKIKTRPTTYYTKKYITNENFFDVIDSEEKAYFLGLMYADGNNYVKKSKSYEMSIKLQEKDKIILEKFRDLISPSSAIKIAKDKSTPNTHYLFKINSKKISEQLSNLGCVPNKSLILEFPTFINKTLLNHFVRGYSDGDGSIYSRLPKTNGHINYAWQITSTFKFCNEFKKLIEKELQIHCSQSLSKPKTNQITTTLSVGGNLQSMKLLNWLYQDATIYLPRKYNKYQEFKNYVENKKNLQLI